MIYSLLFSTLLLFAHEDLKPVQCENKLGKIAIEKTKKGSYQLIDLTNKKTLKLNKPKVTDFYDKQNKQVFDTYIFDLNKQKIIAKRPETKGPVKKIVVEYNKQIFKCQ